MNNHVKSHFALLPTGRSTSLATSARRTTSPQGNEFNTPEETHGRDDINRVLPPSNHTRFTNSSRKAGQHKPTWRYWQFEICAAVFSLSSLVTLIAVLGHFHDRHQSTFKIDFFTPNSIVALLSTAIRASMLACICALLSQWKWNLVGRQDGDRISTLEIYDQASRGPWGCLQLLIGSRPRGLRALPVYPELPDLNTTTIIYTRPFLFTARTYDLPFRTAMYSGFVAGAGEDVTLACPTGNCTFPPTPSLGVCGRCRDVKHSILSSNCRCVPRSFLEGNNNGGCALDEEPICDFTLPNNFSVPSELASSLTKWNGTKYSNSLDGMLSFMVVEYRDPEFAQYRNLSIAGFRAIGFDYQQLSEGPENSTFQIVANSCQLSMCVKEITASVVQGRQQQRINRTWHQPNAPIYNPYGYTFVDIPPEYAPRSAIHNDSFGLGAFFMMAMSQQHNFKLIGNATQRDYAGYEFSTDFVEGIVHTVDYQAYIHNISISLTAAMRRTAAALADPRYEGLALALVPVWKVRWPWITFPVVLVLLTIGSFVLSLLKSHSPTSVPWKGDALSLLLCGVNEQLREPFVQTNGDILSVSKKLGGVQVALRPEHDGWTIAPCPTIADKGLDHRSRG
ncbi:hypothetical protein BDV96DRAFT_604706 [Lophiotrema nucula]|uniref:Uncharacterized protein n=1 Tax=Lophiotrema nucula TaxID=690887 RepID=A0A6A5YQH7_9PLEO|nr:hypothetical protein BDV96DRAFT_604706 [Lophiotrema nucula]